MVSMNRPLPVLYDDMVTRCVKPPPKVPLSMMTIIRDCYAISPTAACTIGFYMKNWSRTLVDHLSSSYLILFDVISCRVVGRGCFLCLVVCRVRAGTDEFSASLHITHHCDLTIIISHHDVSINNTPTTLKQQQDAQFSYQHLR